MAGGVARPDIGPYFFEPTILDGVEAPMAVCNEETFGPVVSIYRFTDEDEVIGLANGTPYGLNSSVWTKDAKRGHAVASRLRTGTVNINEGYAPAYGSVQSPMGGMKDSASAAATAPRASSSTPRRRLSRTSGSCRWRRRSG